MSQKLIDLEGVNSSLANISRLRSMKTSICLNTLLSATMGFHYDFKSGWSAQNKSHFRQTRWRGCDASSLEWVLLSRDFGYYGDSAAKIPGRFKDFFAVTQGHKKRTQSNMINDFIDWSRQQGWGVRDRPGDAIPRPKCWVGPRTLCKNFCWP